MSSISNKMRKTSRALNRVNENGVQFLKPILEFLFIMGLGAGLLLAYGGIYVIRSDNFDPHRQHKPEYTREDFLAIADASETYRSLIQRELLRLRRKSYQLELSLQKVNLQLQALHKHTKIYASLPDLAAEAVGGSIVDTPDTESFQQSENQALHVFGIKIPYWTRTYHSPRAILQPWTEAGECWAFRGSKGNVIIELAQLALVDHVTLEHIPVSASLTGAITSAPREFKVLGEFRDKYLLLGSFIYNYNGPATQTFEINEQDMKKIPLKIIMLQIISNWGNPDYTCIYRFKVHGRVYDQFDSVSSTHN